MSKIFSTLIVLIGFLAAIAEPMNAQNNVTARLHLVSASAMDDGYWTLSFDAFITNNESESITAEKIEFRRVNSTLV